MEVLLHLTSQKLCGFRAQLSFIAALRGFDTDEGVRANKRRRRKKSHTQRSSRQQYLRVSVWGRLCLSHRRKETQKLNKEAILEP